VIENFVLSKIVFLYWLNSREYFLQVIGKAILPCSAPGQNDPVDAARL